MNSTIKTILAGLATAAVVGNVALLWQFNARLATIETKLEFLQPSHFIISQK